MDFRTKTDNVALSSKICHSDKLLVMGSCFAEHIGGRLKQMKFRTVVNPYGVLYNPCSIAAGLVRLLEQHPFAEDELCEFPNEGWNTWLHHSRYSHPVKQMALSAINESIVQGSHQLAEADVLILTLGTAWVYRLSDTNEVVGNCHKVPERRFVRQRLSVQEVVDALAPTLTRIFEMNPRLRVLFTVSPVRHLKDGLHGNQLSKATLLLAVDELCAMFSERCDYFPAYEILMDELRDYRFYADDMAHPSSRAIEYVWQCFTEHCLNAEAQQFMKLWTKVLRALEHRPFRPDSDQYQQFVQQTIARIAELQELYPYLDVCEELSLLRSFQKC
jgi:hypothetical protein